MLGETVDLKLGYRLGKTIDRASYRGFIFTRTVVSISLGLKIPFRSP